MPDAGLLLSLDGMVVEHKLIVLAYCVMFTSNSNKPWIDPIQGLMICQNNALLVLSLL